MKKPTETTIVVAKILVFALCLLPLGHLIWDVAQQTLGPDPVAALEHRSGDWALRLLLLTLAITPLRRFSGVAALIRLRRMLGLFAFFYATLHLTVYLAIDLGGFWRQLFSEIVKRPYITVGFLAWLLLVPLALTSTKGMMRRLGRRWGQLHKLVYPIGLLAVLHYLWQVKFGQKIAVREPLVYLAIYFALMAARLPWPAWFTRLRGQPQPEPVRASRKPGA
ncbi:MAG: sulfoxide reductase heme-binding subunit YedZ [Lysobacterales bacterium 69-70]|nr:sulfoxide reductase heme-binding subunit YedZ [Xanthomonadaceae bacterium]ODU33434.1 MAG: sulfoxide reductase heme-binding subunit YedZ [Xanthomonadaceae bacterium SCN 69-320]ODV17764.1 MAG: sulfoxide reductase heme-binding subunit YedZ [Xanthomonadaceae bacterium SCN 69-25]OJZ00975.1 MAG: sulfoxide reductase heme-binding subunit YedZ [Xanthomonadales bacterium 69-70]